LRKNGKGCKNRLVSLPVMTGFAKACKIDQIIYANAI
jgi:hypothetical protein